jgi:lipopolysaccharide transport system ATP-binding protein
MGAVRSLCSTGLVLSAGKLVYTGDITSSIETYHRLVATAEKHDDPAANRARGSGFSKISLDSHEGTTIQQPDEMEISTELHLDREVAGFVLLCVLEDMNQRRVLTMRRDSSEMRSGRWKGSYRISLRFPALWLEPGLYTLYFKAMLQGQSAASRHVSDVFHLDVGGRSSGSGSVLSPNVNWTLHESGRAEEVAIA